MSTDITVPNLTRLFEKKVEELGEDPNYQWNEGAIKHATKDGGKPRIKLAVGNVPLDYDLWEGLRNPAMIGQYPIGLEEIWEFYADRRRSSTDEAGRGTIFRVPRSFQSAKEEFNRAAIISVMLPFSSSILDEYSGQLLEKERQSSHLFSRMYEDVNQLLDKTVTRAGMELLTPQNVVLAMDNETVSKISSDTVPETRQGEAHGPCKGGNYPQKSVAALMGLGQFGVSRILFRDELIDGEVRRFVGPIRSLVVFDKKEPVVDGSGGLIYPAPAWRDFLFQLFDFTNTEKSINRNRFCTHLAPGFEGEGCGQCINNCPSAAQANSAPAAEGSYPDRIADQRHRFWEDKLQFDFASCCEDRGQMGDLFDEWSCARCLATCASMGDRRKEAVENFYSRMDNLARSDRLLQSR